MGLDSYLSVTVSVDKRDANYQKVVDTLRIKPDRSASWIDVNHNVAYWRKANAIHSWFVKNVQDGVDDCRKAFVSRDQLEKLVDLCIDIKNNKLNPENSLPTQSGFFFGSTEYDDYYTRDLEYTIDVISSILMNPDYKDASFYYRSSW
jgi:hypothetical protein